MRLTKLTHAGVKLVKDGATLVIDPGSFPSGNQALTEADAVLITHEHSDHVDEDALRAALAARPGEPVPTLLVPVCAPWLKFADFTGYFRAVNPRRGFAVHDGMLSEFGLRVLASWLEFAAEGRDTELTRLEPGTAVDL